MTSRIIGSSAVTAFGVNTRLTSARSRSCSGGSIMMMLLKLWISSESFESVDEIDAVRARVRLPIAVRGQHVGETRDSA